MFNNYTGAQYTQYISLITRHVIQVKTTNKSFVDMRLRPGIATQLAVVAATRNLHVMSCIKPEVHNMS